MEEKTSNRNVVTKIHKARKLILDLTKSKGGYNKFSKYDYFTPEQVYSIVESACQEVGIVTIFALGKNENGDTYGHLVVYDIDSDQHLDIKQLTSVPDMSASNTTQQYGGCATYTERYMLQTLFRVLANDTVDFDANNKSTKPTQKTITLVTKNQLDRLNELVNKKGISFDLVKEAIKKHGFSSSKEITQDKFGQVYQAISLL